MNKKILYIDMDGCVADFDKAIKPLLAPYPDLNEQETYDKVDEILPQHPEFFHDLEPMPNSIETVKKLSEVYDIYFLSTPMWIMPESFTGKRIWIEKHFGELAVKRLILTHRKDLNVGDYLIDDRTHNGAGEFTGEHIHFGTEKFPDWDSVYEYLMLENIILPSYEKTELSFDNWVSALLGSYKNNQTLTFK
jgi:5'(3')-deoxyribonucleotidase